MVMKQNQKNRLQLPSYLIKQQEIAIAMMEANFKIVKATIICFRGLPAPPPPLLLPLARVGKAKKVARVGKRAARVGKRAARAMAVAKAEAAIVVIVEVDRE